MTLSSLKALVSRPAFALYGGIAVGALAILVLYRSSFLGGQKMENKPEIAQPTELDEKAERRMERLELAVLALTEAQAASLATKYARPDVRYVPGPPGAPGAAGEPGKDGATRVLTETTTSTPAPAGVDILTTVGPDGQVENTVVAKPEKFMALPAKWRLYGEGLVGDDFDVTRYSVRLGAEFDALRVGSFHLIPKVEGFREPLRLDLSDDFDSGFRLGLRVSWEPR